MNVSEPGVLRDSAAYFHTCSAQAKKMFFYPLCTGRYRCDGTYRMERTHYDSFLVMYVARGSGYWSSGGQEIPVPEGSLLFLDCYRPHCYGTRSGWEIYWLHFDGVLARPYFETFTADGAFLMQSDAAVCVRSVRKIFESFDRRCPVSEPMISKRINDLLTGAILALQQEKKQLKRLGAIDESVQFIAEHVEQPLTLEQLAASVSLSPFYFARLFKQETGFPPPRIHRARPGGQGEISADQHLAAAQGDCLPVRLWQRVQLFHPVQKDERLHAAGVSDAGNGSGGAAAPEGYGVARGAPAFWDKTGNLSAFGTKRHRCAMKKSLFFVTL